MTALASEADTFRLDKIKPRTKAGLQARSGPWYLGSQALQVRFTRSKVSQLLGEMCVPRSSRTVAQSLPLQTLQFVDKSFVPFERPHGFIT